MNESKNSTTINISTSTIFKVLIFLLIIYLVFLLSEIIIVLFVSLVLAALITPWVDFAQKKRIPRGLSVLFIYLILFTVLSFIVFSIVPPIVTQINDFSKDSPEYLDKVFSNLSFLDEKFQEKGILENIKDGLGTFDSNLGAATGGVFSLIGSFFGGVFFFVLVLVITFYMVTEENAMKKVVWSVVPEKHQPYIIQLLGRMQKKVGLWLRGQIILSIIMFVAVYLGLLFLGVKYALVLGLIAAFTEFVLYLGPLIAAVPALLISFIQSPLLFVFVLIFYYVLNMIESHVLVPKIMQKVVGLNPIIIIVVLIVGFKIGGILGGVLAIPVATAASVFLRDVFERRRADEEGSEGSRL